MTTEQEFLARVAQRLGRDPQSAPARPAWKPSKPLAAVGPTDPEALATRFAAELEKLSAHVHRVSSPSDVAPLIVRILLDAGAKGGRVTRWDDSTLEGLGIDEALKAGGHEVVTFQPGSNGRAFVEKVEQSVAGITGCDAAIAETGTLVLGSSRIGDPQAPGRGRTVSLLPPIHVAVVRKEQIVYSSLDVFRRLASGAMPSQVIFASGPSRSSDIENDLSIGVHGPGHLHVIIL